MTASIFENDFTDPESIENLKILRGLQLCMHLEISNLMIESDCLIVVEELQHPEASCSLLSNLLLDINKTMMANFQECSI